MMKNKSSKRKNFANKEMLSFLEQLEKSETLKIKYNGKFYPVPKPILNQAKKFAAEAVGIDYDVFRNNPTSEKAKEKQVKKAFEQFLESYFEAVAPQTSSNPAPKIAEAVYKVMDQIVDAERPGGLMDRFFPGNENRVVRTHRASALKGSIMNITHTFTEGALKIDRKSYGYPVDATLEQMQEVDFNRLVRSSVAFITIALISKLYTIKPEDLVTVLGSEIPKEELNEFWKDPKKSEMFFRRVKERANTIFSKIDLLDLLK